jgi:hypothetical protein
MMRRRRRRRRRGRRREEEDDDDDDDDDDRVLAACFSISLQRSLINLIMHRMERSVARMFNVSSSSGKSELLVVVEVSINLWWNSKEFKHRSWRQEHNVLLLFTATGAVDGKDSSECSCSCTMLLEATSLW